MHRALLKRHNLMCLFGLEMDYLGTMHRAPTLQIEKRPED